MPESSRMISFSTALNEALREEMIRNHAVFVFGEDIAQFGGRNKVTIGLFDLFGAERVIDTSMNEELFVGMALGAAQMGMRPIVEFVSANFLHLAASDIFLMGMWRSKCAGKVILPLVLRSTISSKKATSTEFFGDPIATYLSVPGIKIVAPSSPATAKSLLKSAIRDDNPVLFFEHDRLYSEQGLVPAEEYVVSLGQARLALSGTRATLISYGYLAHLIERDLYKYCVENEVEVIDLLSIKPLDMEMILASVKKTKKVLIVEEGWVMGGVGAEILSLIHEQCPEVRGARHGAKNIPIPAGDLADVVLPGVESIRVALGQLLDTKVL